ncbi:TPA: hypothetical protein HA241_07205 [Candidatus Woesearchaeota archaeon]|nr:hypothetical protein [Candidatus Woesearchaeota archaeon]
MSDSVKAYHGTSDLEGVTRGNAIKSPDFQQSEDYWLVRKQEYDVLTQKFAEAARDHIKSGFLFDGFGNDSRLLANDEALADLVETYDIQLFNPAERIDYKELKRTLFVYLADQQSGSVNFARSREEGQTGALLEFKIPKSLLRPSFWTYRGHFTVMEVAREVSLKFLQQIFVSTEDLARAVKLLDERGLEEVRVNEFKRNSTPRQ